MALEVSVIKKIVDGINDKQETPKALRYRLRVLVNDKGYEISRVNLIDHYSGALLNNNELVMEDALSDYIMVIAYTDYLMFRELIWPNRDNLVIEIVSSIKADVGVNSHIEQLFTVNYRGILLNRDDMGLANNYRETTSPLEEQVSDLVELKLQLIESAIYENQMRTLGGVVKEGTPKDLIQYALGFGLDEEPSDTQLKDPSYKGVKGVQVIEPDNTAELTNLIIDEGTRNVDIPRWLQAKEGVYSSGLGYHYQRGWWYVYPRRNHAKLAEVELSINIVVVPAQEMAVPDRSHAYYDNKLVIITNGMQSNVDDKHSVRLNTGNGIRYAPTSSIMDGMSSHDSNKATATGRAHQKSINIAPAVDEYNHVPYVDGLYTDNPYMALSQASRNLGRYVKLTWAKSMHHLLRPGLPVDIYYVSRGDMMTYKGVLQGHRTTTTTPTLSITDSDYLSTTEITVYIQDT